ncbi:hypothetical protein [Chondrinema litorale]|uniref:hypothetical protein n=1 Tax=Chondrinema litorale TaxID=2994555 RepID=UPI0025439203|nr:hypothetical protein [Chondrinema litorale]UZR94359.1 hypothetical protein OQ292_00825 [Chondrinema litorale]
MFPFIKGSIPGYIFAFLSFPIVFLLSKKQVSQYFLLFVLIFLFFILYSFASQILLFLSFLLNLLPEPIDVVFISEDSNIILKKSLFTQSIYFIACILFFLFVLFFYDATKHDKYILLGVLLMIFYGCYEFIYYLFSNGKSGDFISNRYFGDLPVVVNGINKGSSAQGMNIFGYHLLRFKSLTNEPSMYVFSLLPVGIYFFHIKKIKFSILVIVTLFLTFSTTFVIGIFIYFVCRLYYKGISNKYNFYGILLLIISTIIFFPYLVEFIEISLVEKITLQNSSGTQRFDHFLIHLKYFINMPIWNQLFGIGFGYIRATNYFSCILVNNGYLGFLFLTFVFFYPIFKLKRSERNWGLKFSLIVMYITLMISVPEIFYLSIWLFLGMAYNQLLLETEKKLILKI